MVVASDTVASSLAEEIRVLEPELPLLLRELALENDARVIVSGALERLRVRSPRRCLQRPDWDSYLEFILEGGSVPSAFVHQALIEAIADRFAERAMAQPARAAERLRLPSYGEGFGREAWERRARETCERRLAHAEQRAVA